LCFFSFQLLKENSQNVSSQQYHINVIGNKDHFESTQDNSVPLCFSSFNIWKKSFKIVNEAEKFKLEQSHMNQDFKIRNQQKSITIFHDPTYDYMEGFNSCMSQPIISCKYESKSDDGLVSKSAISLFPKDILLQ
jgi:hypothetical protein